LCYCKSNTIDIKYPAFIAGYFYLCKDLNIRRNEMFQLLIEKKDDGEFFFKVYTMDYVLVDEDSSYSYPYVYSALSFYGLEEKFAELYPVQ
jgi:hypothetical protein